MLTHPRGVIPLARLPAAHNLLAWRKARWTLPRVGWRTSRWRGKCRFLLRWLRHRWVCGAQKYQEFCTRHQTPSSHRSTSKSRWRHPHLLLTPITPCARSRHFTYGKLSGVLEPTVLCEDRTTLLGEFVVSTLQSFMHELGNRRNLLHRPTIKMNLTTDIIIKFIKANLQSYS